MDANKRLKLIEINYTIKPSCGTCKFFKQHVDENFGDCQVHEYEHLKHTGKIRKLSVVQYGSCNSYVSENDMNWLHGFKEFLTSPAE